MSKKPNLATALHNANGKPDLNKSTLIQETAKNTEKEIQIVPASRVGKKAITGFFDPAVSKQFKRLALEQDKTVQVLIAEAINDLFEKYGQMPIA
jgi:hypothetical protein